MLCPMPTTRAQQPPGPPAGLTLLLGGEDFLAGRALSRVVAGARAVDPSVERREVDAQEPDAVGDLQTALSPSLFGEPAVVVVTGLSEASATFVAALLAGIEDLAPDMWVVVRHPGTRNKVLDQLRAAQVPGGVMEVACGAVKRGADTRNLLVTEARAAGRRLTNDGADALVQAIGSNVALLVGALEQLLADNPEDPIDHEAVTSTFAGVAEVSGFQLADAVWEGHALLALQRLRWGLSSNTITGPGAVGSLASGLRSMVRVAGAPRGMSKDDVARTTGVPSFKVPALRAAADSWEPAQLADAAVRLAAADAQVKGGVRPGESLEPAQKVHALESFLIRTAGLGEGPRGPRGRRSGGGPRAAGD